MISKIQLLSIFLVLSFAQCSPIEKVDGALTNNSITSLTAQKMNHIPVQYCPHKNYEYFGCDDHYPYRNFDGACNNLYVPWWGKYNTPYARHLFPAYDDGYDSPKTKSVIKGYDLPNARKVALSIHSPRPTFAETSMLFVFFGQHVMHDLVLTSITSYSNGHKKACGCDEYEDPDCFQITIPEGDYYNHDQKCFPFTRSTAAIEIFDCTYYYREQLNTVTAWLDQNVVYGNNIFEARELRTYEYGLLKTSVAPHGAHDLPIKRGCSFDHTQDCYLGGDSRMQDNLYLTMFTKIFVLEHNRIAYELSSIYPSWNDETLFQEARKLMIAEYQHIIYYEFLPLLVGSLAYEKWELEPLKGKELFDEYEKHTSPQVKSAFIIAARFGHVLVNQNHLAYDKNYDLQFNVTTNYVLFTHTYYHDNVLRGSALQNSYYSSPAINNDLNNYLFEGLSPDFKRLSLGALNIQRGRDQGLPGYNEYRRLCGLNYAYSFDELTNIPVSVQNELKYLYWDVNDIDLFTGMTSEYAVDDGVVGETAACIIGSGFRDWKYGDRFYYENDFKLTGFTGEQLEQIRKSSMARILCDNSDFYFIQTYPFLLAHEDTNPLVDCSSIRSVDLAQWDY